jgi:hypothetical protein
MQQDRQAYFRAQAEYCFQHAEETADSASKLRWLTLGEEWLLLAAEGRREVLDEVYGEPSAYPALRQVYNH